MKRTSLLSLVFVMVALAFAGNSYSSGERTVTDAAGEVIIKDATAEDIPLLIGLLDRGGAVEASRAIDILAGFGTEAVPALLGALKKGPAYENIMIALGHINDPRAIKPVAAFINDEDWNYANMAMGVLRGYGDTASAELVRLMSDPKYTDAAVDVLRSIQPSDESLDAVRKLSSSPVPGERAAAAYLLGLWQDTGSADTIKGLIGDKDETVRVQAIQGYQMMYLKNRERYDTGMLVGLLKDPNAKIREYAIRMLADQKAPAIVEPLIEVIKTDPERYNRGVAVEALENKYDDRVVLPLIELIGDEDATSDELSNAIYILGQMKAKEAVPHIVDVYRRGTVESGAVLQMTFNALRDIAEPVELAIFMPYLVEGNPHYVGTDQLLGLLESQAKPGDEEVIEALHNLIEKGTKKRWEVRARAILDRIE